MKKKKAKKARSAAQIAATKRMIAASARNRSAKARTLPGGPRKVTTRKRKPVRKPKRYATDATENQTAAVRQFGYHQRKDYGGMFRF